MKTENKSIERKILDTLMGQKFADWYGWSQGTADSLGENATKNRQRGRFEEFMEGYSNPPTEREILEDIRKLFHL